MHACRKLVENVIFFRNLPINLLVRIISCLRIEVYLVNDVIIRANTPGTSMYFISTGTVAIYTKSGKEVRFMIFEFFFCGYNISPQIKSFFKHRFATWKTVRTSAKSRL